MKRPSDELYNAFAWSLLLFCKRLHNAAIKQNVHHLFFLAREGYQLKSLFSAYYDALQCPHPLATQYLEVSRKATYLPSLRESSSETFSELLSAYPHLSISGFLRSLNLCKYHDDIIEALGMSDLEGNTCIYNIEKSSLFRKLVNSSRFVSAYDSERKTQERGLLTYLRQVAGGSIPERFGLVDVGWRGSMQDNIARCLIKAGHLVNGLTGFYIGLHKNKPIYPPTEKYCLLFDFTRRNRRDGRYIFSENRALFEIVLHADHGAVAGYVDGTNQHNCVVHEPFFEKQYIADMVAPVMQLVRCYFDNLIADGEHTRPERHIYQNAISAHKSLVFDPSEQTIDWFEHLIHRENFGVFADTTFNRTAQEVPRRNRLITTLRFALSGRFEHHSFWPFVTLLKSGVSPAARVYSEVRAFRAKYF